MILLLQMVIIHLEPGNEGMTRFQRDVCKSSDRRYIHLQVDSKGVNKCLRIPSFFLSLYCLEKEGAEETGIGVALRKYTALLPYHHFTENNMSKRF